ncbi:hypothetical protein NDU88_006401 [Pleurodeles waltl]|uniref:Uncharacterized protein n=1 Tax=Pleurodeles waltl TaxID=8319 RepID=A0AAV7TEQ2_PLEWA|nr:hypothetical protein NDU88_006401 [Pleurodeles waltl]
MAPRPRVQVVVSVFSLKAGSSHQARSSGSVVQEAAGPRGGDGPKEPVTIQAVNLCRQPGVLSKVWGNDDYLVQGLPEPCEQAATLLTTPSSQSPFCSPGCLCG